MNAMNRERLSTSLLSEVFDYEEDAYRLCLREAERIGAGPPGTALRSMVAHAGEALEALPTLAAGRKVTLGSARSLVVDTFHRLRDAALDHVTDREHGYRRALAAVHEGIDLVRLTREAAANEGDDALATWCARWLEVRERFAADAARELAWFASHPRLARLVGAPAT